MIKLLPTLCIASSPHPPFWQMPRPAMTHASRLGLGSKILAPKAPCAMQRRHANIYQWGADKGVTSVSKPQVPRRSTGTNRMHGSGARLGWSARMRCVCLAPLWEPRCSRALLLQRPHDGRWSLVAFSNNLPWQFESWHIELLCG